MKFGITQTVECAYLPGQQERLAVLVEPEMDSSLAYDLLIQSGFRRSAEQLYRPHCTECHACQSLRLPVERFIPSSSQRRISNKNRDVEVLLSAENKPEYYSLYFDYISERHTDGSMYPPSKEQYESFLGQSWTHQQFIEFRIQNDLVAVAVIDEVDSGLSALYTFYAPELAYRSLGIFSILTQIELCRLNNKRYLYLGYQIDDCNKMNYKANFYPHERFIGNKWYEIVKKQPC
ncbi:arginyltransferase [Neptunicella marina]|uniref:Aspartate/glutamate leucyltransferase n=1 Tax=Neptunicella marina TaxID=2125989 RepID=A0A8J6IQT0_9ALTE|nr:arginyltransferase [Neptunicella marina]MBC3764282.1 arginyltransferase [Neptunicella marina]